MAIFFTGQFPPFANPNELSRLEAVYAAGELGTLSIDGAIPVLGDKANVPLNINLNDPARAFKVLDFDVVFYDDAMGHSYTVQVEVEDAGGE